MGLGQATAKYLKSHDKIRASDLILVKVACDPFKYKYYRSLLNLRLSPSNFSLKRAAAVAVLNFGINVGRTANARLDVRLSNRISNYIVKFLGAVLLHLHSTLQLQIDPRLFRL